MKNLNLTFFRHELLIIVSLFFPACNFFSPSRSDDSQNIVKSDSSEQIDIRENVSGSVKDSVVKSMEKNILKDSNIYNSKSYSKDEIQSKIHEELGHNRNVQKSVSLKEKYRNFFPIGTSIEPSLLDTVSKSNFIVSQYSSLTPENYMKPVRLQPREGEFDWVGADRIVDFAVKNKMKVRGHCLIWFYRMPNWFFIKDGKAVSKEVLFERMKKHITAVVSRYKGRVYCWDVVNEAVSAGNVVSTFKKEDKLFQIAGEEYIEKAFQYAHAADPTAKLFYNDYGYHNDRKKRNKIYELLKRLKAKGIPINGVGFQTHLGIDGMQEYQLRDDIKLFSNIGLEVQITELDVSIFKRGAKAADLVGVNDNYSSDIKAKQEEIYEMIFRVCREFKGKVTGITLWGAMDAPSYLSRVQGKKNYPSLFDDKMKPKDVVFKITNFN